MIQFFFGLVACVAAVVFAIFYTKNVIAELKKFFSK